MNSTNDFFNQGNIVSKIHLDEILANDEKKSSNLELKYIPKVNIQTSEVFSIEPSVFFVHRDSAHLAHRYQCKGSYKLSAFKVFEKSVDCSLKDCAEWDKIGKRFSISINTPAALLMNNWCPSYVHEALEKHKIEPQRLTINVYPDHSDMGNKDLLCSLASLNLMGVRLCLSNFGGDSTALSALSSIKFDEVRIDKEVTQKIAYSEKHKEILSQLTNLAHRLGLQVSADGVKYKFQKEILEICGVDYIQGEYLNSPVTSDEITLFLSKFRT
ncbi:EAL domain-containing protein [Vibrio maerlii]|uniref:EAL domain-containing protein n=1 Tax=Vibrio maerlii TaxID=2231648 RepID=UPI000E3E26F9|nr:EAL domain-containing protein [Vibrio maerlii]